jgi:hypothetical protein
MDLFFVCYVICISQARDILYCTVPTIKCSGINGSSAEKRRLFQANLCFPCRTFECDVAEGLKISDRLMMYVMPTSKYVVGGQLL